MYKEIADIDGHVSLPETGDELIDKWEKEIAMGIEPDLEEGYTQARREKLKQERSKLSGAKQKAKQLDGFNENYSPQNVAILGRENKSVPSNLMEFAKNGGLSNMDPATIRRIMAQLTPEQAADVLKLINNK